MIDVTVHNLPEDMRVIKTDNGISITGEVNPSNRILIISNPDLFKGEYPPIECSGEFDTIIIPKQLAPNIMDFLKTRLNQRNSDAGIIIGRITLL